ncbi:MAG: oligosaccharide flippase family protein [Paraglaciecola sp.]|nr:oligosaccharide flippase family protein [Paraglaciecola sp.]
MTFKKVFAFSIGPIGAAFLSFISLPIITWFFEPEDIGRIAMLQVLLSFCVLLFSLGLDQAYVREYHESDNTNSLFYACCIPGLIVLFISICVVFLIPVSVSNLLFGLDSLLIELMVVVCLLFSFISRFLSLILRMQGRGVAFSMGQLLPKLIFLLVICSYILFVLNFRFIHLFLAHLISITCVTLIFIWNTRSILFVVFREKIDFKKLQSMLHFGTPLIFGGLAFWGLTAMDKAFLRAVSTFDELAQYSVAVSFAAAAVIFQSVFSTLWAPTVYKWAADGVDLHKIDQITEYVLIAVLLLFSFAGLFSWLVIYLLPDGYVDVQYILVCCMAYPLFYTLSESTVVGLGIKKRAGILCLPLV